MSHVSATNELPLSAISFVKHPESPDEADKSALTFDHYYQNQARNEISPLATNERPLSCTCLPKLLTDNDNPDLTHFQTKFDDGIDDEFLLADIPVLSSSCPLPHGHICTPNENHINSADFRERLNAFNAWRDEQRKSSAPRIFINDKLPKMSDLKAMQTTKRIHPNALHFITRVPHGSKHAALFSNKPIIVTSSTPHLSDPCTSNAFCHTKHYSIMSNNSSSSNSTTSNIVTNDNNTTIPHPNIVKIHSDATTTTQTSTTRRQRHSIAGQNLGFFKIMDIAGGFSRKMTTSTNSLFSTAVISGSSSAPNLHQINAASPSGKEKEEEERRSFSFP